MFLGSCSSLGTLLEFACDPWWWPSWSFLILIFMKLVASPPATCKEVFIKDGSRLMTYSPESCWAWPVQHIHWLLKKFSHWIRNRPWYYNFILPWCCHYDIREGKNTRQPMEVHGWNHSHYGQDYHMDLSNLIRVVMVPSRCAECLRWTLYSGWC